MFTSRSVRPSPALVVASIALFIALGGGAYAAAKLPADSVGARQLRSSSVSSSEVLDRSLRAVDFKPGQLPAGPRGASGERGPAGPKGDAGPRGERGPSALADVKVRTQTGELVQNNIIKRERVYCVFGEVATGGGGHVGAVGMPDVAITRSEPIFDTYGTPIGWEIIVANHSGWAQELGVYAICAKP